AGEAPLFERESLDGGEARLVHLVAPKLTSEPEELRALALPQAPQERLGGAPHLGHGHAQVRERALQVALLVLGAGAGAGAGELGDERLGLARQALGGLTGGHGVMILARWTGGGRRTVPAALRAGVRRCRMGESPVRRWAPTHARRSPS